MASNPLTDTNTPASQRAQGEYAHEANDEIDLVELIRALWAGKWLILSITLASTLIALIYLQIFPYYTVSFTVKANPIAEKHVYDVLNEAIDLLAEKAKDRFVDNDLLAQLWIEDMTRYETIEQALIDHHYLPEKTDETEREFKRRLRYKAHQYELSADDAKSWSMKFTSHMPETDRVVLEQALSQSNSNVRTVLEEKFRHKVNTS